MLIGGDFPRDRFRGFSNSREIRASRIFVYLFTLPGSVEYSRGNHILDA
jgi:hypothetical protein